ncbi:MAG: molybdopterin converting factor subunit 1 [Alphaproteobacteria bacterium]
MKLLYFAWLKDRIGTDEEDLDLPGSVTTVSALVDWLIARGDNYAAAFENRDIVRAAVNQDYAEADAAIAPGDEVAFFPPVTGG